MRSKTERPQPPCGEGGNGIVYLAEEPATRRLAAPKVMLPKIASDKKAQADFLRETENTTALRHRNAVQLFDYGCSNGTFFMTLGYCDGGSVDKIGDFGLAKAFEFAGLSDRTRTGTAAGKPYYMPRQKAL